MIISVNWLKKFVDIDMAVDDLVALIGSRLVEVEEVIDLGSKYKDAVIVKVIGASKIESSDHLSLVKIDDAGVNDSVERDSDGLVQVVCGALNISKGQNVVWLPPKSIVPNTYNKPEPFVLGARKLQGFVSNGMIASPYELDLSDDHNGILVIKDDIKPGTMFSIAYEYDDYLLDIENKSLTHRPDCFGIIGFAREVAAITSKKFNTPDWMMNLLPNYSEGEYSLKVKIENKNLSPRYQAVVMSNANGYLDSPLLIQTYLSRIGMRPINAVVDVTNYLMVLTGQPLHAFDYDKLLEINNGRAEIIVRSGINGETLELLDGKQIELSSEDVVISAGEKAVALAGAMGGASTAIDENTKNIILECATFNLYNLRGTQMRHGIFSEAITRFTKGQPAGLTAPVLYDAIRLISEWSGASQVSSVAEDYPVKHQIVDIEVSVPDINKLLGTNFSVNDLASILGNAEFSIEISDDRLKITVPYWRADIHILEDIVEEAGRLSGYDNILCTLPVRDFKAVSPSGYDNFRQVVRQILARAGLNEVLTYSFVHGDIIKKAHQDKDNSYRIVNSISPDLQYYRQSLTPSLLDTINPNIKQGYDGFGVFEINKTHAKSHGLDQENVPVEVDSLSVVLSMKTVQPGSPYYHAKTILDYLLNSIGVSLGYLLVDENKDNLILRPFERLRSADVSGIGYIGEYKSSVKRSFKLPDFTSGFELDLRALYDLYQNSERKYKPISRYPSTDRDITFVVDTMTQYDSVVQLVRAGLLKIDLESEVIPVGIYSPDNSDKKHISFRIRYTSYSHTLTSDEANSANQTVINHVVASIKAIVI